MNKMCLVWISSAILTVLAAGGAVATPDEVSGVPSITGEQRTAFIIRPEQADQAVAARALRAVEPQRRRRSSTRPASARLGRIPAANRNELPESRPRPFITPVQVSAPSSSRKLPGPVVIPFRDRALMSACSARFHGCWPMRWPPRVTCRSCHGIVKLIECRLFSAFLHEAKLLNLRGGAIDNVPRFRSESG